MMFWPQQCFPPTPAPKCRKSTFLYVLISQKEAWPYVWSSDEVVLGRGELFFTVSLVLTAGELTLALAPSSQPHCHCNNTNEARNSCHCPELLGERRREWRGSVKEKARSS